MEIMENWWLNGSTPDFKCRGPLFELAYCKVLKCREILHQNSFFSFVQVKNKFAHFGGLNNIFL